MIGRKVEHIKFGEGVIVKQEEDRLEVAFANTTKCFQYPGAFEKFLKTVDAETKKLVTKELKKQKKLDQKQEDEKPEKEESFFRIEAKSRPAVHGAFDVSEQELAEFIESRELHTLSKKINMKSVCVLTSKREGASESTRVVEGVFMTKDDYIGEQSISSTIPAHEQYVMILKSNEPVYYWSAFPEYGRKEKWGNRKMREIPVNAVKELINRMFVSVDSEDEQRQQIIRLDQYFSEMNSI